MAFFGNLEGTLRNVLSIGKNSKVSVRNNGGVLEGQNSAGAWLPVLPPRVEARSANFTAEYNVVYLITNAVNVQLPAPVLNGMIKLKLLGTADVTVVRAGSEQIETVAANYVLTSTREAATLVSDGTNWFRI